MRKIVSILLVLILIIGISTLAFAAGSPTIEGALVPTITGTKYITNLGNSVTLKFDPIKNIKDYAQISNLLYVFQISSTYELEEDEYIDISIYVYIDDIENLNAVVQETGHRLETNQIDVDHWSVRLTEFGTIIITYI